METIGEIMGGLTGTELRTQTKTTERAQYKCNLPCEKLAEVLKHYYRLEVGKDAYDNAYINRCCRSVARWLTAGKRGLMITGHVGTGKTTIVKCLGYMFTAAGVQYMRVKATDIADCVLDNKEYFDGRICGKKFNGFSAADFLLLDDVGTEPVVVKDYGNEIAPFQRIVESRYELKLPIVIATNLTMDDIEKYYGIRTSDRLKEMCEVLVMDHKSFRV